MTSQRAVERFREILRKVDREIPACPSVPLGLPVTNGETHTSKRRGDDD